MRNKIIILISTCIYLFQTGCVEDPLSSIFHFDNSDNRVLFYAISIENNRDIGIYIMDPDSLNAELIIQGAYSYPIWQDTKDKIAYQDLTDCSVEIRSLNDRNSPPLECIPYNQNFLFMRHSILLGSYLFSSQIGGGSKIVIMNDEGDSCRTISQSNYFEGNPVTSAFGSRIYFSREVNGFDGIFRMDRNGENVGEILSCRANLNTFSVSYDGSLIVSPRYVDDEGDIIVFDLESNQILHEIFPSVPGIPLYTSFSSDNRTVYFVNGFPNDYSKPRNLYRVDIDGSNLEQLTHFTDRMVSRPLAW